MSLKEVAEREKRNAAFHEAGHAVILRHFGGEGQARIWPNKSGNPDEKTWIGHFQLFDPPPLPREQWGVSVGLAGLIAEYIADDVEFDDIGEMIDDILYTGDGISATDATLIGDAWTLDDIEQTARLLLGVWGAVEKEAQELIAGWDDECEEA